MSAQIQFEAEELLETHPIAEPLFAGSVRCHGGFDADGAYVSPRTKNRVPAIEAWQERHEKLFGKPILDVPLDRWPVHYPNVAQSKLLLREGVSRPMVVSLTRVGTVEGFGGAIRMGAVQDLQRHFVEDISGTSLEHLTRGLYEAHARDEAGHEDEGGHREMWYAARDLAFEGVSHEEAMSEVGTLLGGGGPGAYAGAGVTPEMRANMARQMRARALESRALPDDIDVMLEMQIGRMIRLLFIELAAFRTFEWAEEVLSDPDLVAGEGAAGRLVTYIRADERPHVAYLRTALTEMRDRTLVGSSGARYSGEQLVGGMWERALEQSLGQNRTENRRSQLRMTESALEGNPRAASILEEFHALGFVRPAPDGSFVEVEPPRPS